MPDDPDVNDVRNALFLNMANGPDQLRQRMMFALSQIIVVSANKNEQRQRAGAVGAAAVTQRLRQLPRRCSAR